MGVLNPSKQELRKKLLEVRDGLEHRREREEAIAENLLSLPQYRRAASLLLCISAEPAKWALLLFCAGLWSREKRFVSPIVLQGTAPCFSAGSIKQRN